MLHASSPLDRLYDEAAIGDLNPRFADILIRAKYETFSSLWTDDAQSALGGAPVQPFERNATGVEEIGALFRDRSERNDHLVHVAVHEPSTDEGDKAAAICICHGSALEPERFHRTHGIWTDHHRSTDAGRVLGSRSYRRYLRLGFTPFPRDAFPIHSAA